MAAAIKGKIVITFNADALNTETISFKRSNPSYASDVDIVSTFQTEFRSLSKYIKINTPTATPGEMSAMDFEYYFNLDHNASSIMTISRVVNVVTIEADSGWDFKTFVSPFATAVITAGVPSSFKLTRASLQVHPTLPCDKVDVEIICTEIPDTYTILTSTEATFVGSTATFTVSIDRTIRTTIYVTKDGVTYNISLQQWGVDYFYFRKLYAYNLNIYVTPNPLLGATVTINQNYGSQLQQQPVEEVHTYSLDGITYQSSNIFTGQTDGDYTVYVKNNTGCTIEKDYTVSGSAGRDAYFFLSDVNSATFSKNEVWDGLQDGIHKNSGNVLALTERNDFLYEEKELVRVSDSIRIQFKSNYDSHSIKIEDCEGNEVSSSGYPPEKMSNNLDLFESLDGNFVSLNGVAVIYFTSGVTYNEAGGNIGTFELFGNLPDCAIIGASVDIAGFGIHIITNLIYDPVLDKKCMVFGDYIYGNTSPTTLIIKAYYDLLPFEVYEFNVNFSSVIIKGGLSEEVRLRIDANDSLYDNMSYYTDYIYILSDSEYFDIQGINKMVAINYYNDNNRDIFYLYGITHFFRIPIQTIEDTIIDESENEKGDLTTYLSNSSVYKGVKITFADVTNKMKVKLCIALSSSNLFINGIGYAKETGLEVTKIQNTNLYTVSCELVETGKNFNILGDSETGNVEVYNPLYIPRTIGTGTGLIKV